jgi:hypothetical protein
MTRMLRLGGENELTAYRARLAEKLDWDRKALESRLVPKVVGETRPESKETAKIGPVGRPEQKSGSEHLKYRNRPTGGYQSTREARRAGQLRILEVAGEIFNLREQVPFVLLDRQFDAKGKMLEREVRYFADFTYEDKAGNLVVEDAKGIRTPDYVIKRKLMLHRHKIRIVEV